MYTTYPHHIVGDLHLVSEAEFKILFEAKLPVLRAARGSKIILVGPLARYAIHSCCSDPSHVSNSNDPGFVTGIKDQLLSIGKALKNLVHVRRIKNAKVLNPARHTTPWRSRSWTRSTPRLSSMQDCRAPDLPHLDRIEELERPVKSRIDKGKIGHAALRLLLITSTTGAATT